MKKHICLPSFVLLVFLTFYSPLSAEKIKLSNDTPYAVTVAIKGEGLVFASELPRVALLSPGESFLFDAGLGSIEEITAFMCGVVTQFVIDIKKAFQYISLTTISDILVLSMNQQDKKTKASQSPLLLKGAVIKQTRLKCPCVTNQ